MNIFPLPQVPGNRIVRALEKAEFIVLRQSGSHVVMRHKLDLTRRAVVPLHGSKTVKPGTLRAILKGANLSIDEFKNLI